MKKKGQFYLDFEGSSGNSHFRAMTALYFFQHLVQMGTFQHYFSLINESYFAKDMCLSLICEFLPTFRAFLAILLDVIFPVLKRQHFTLPKMSIMSVYRPLFILINK